MRKLGLVPLIALVMTACGGATTAPSPTPTRAPIKITVGFSEIYEGMLPMWYAAANGIFEKNGLTVDLQYTSSSTGVSALLADRIQIFQGGGSEVLSANAEGADIVLIGNLVPVYPYVFMTPADIKTLADLKGKKVGASSAGSTSDIATKVGLAKEGLDPDKDVTIVYVGSSQNRTAALLNGSIQGGLDQPPSSFGLADKGFHVLFDMAALKLPVVNNGISVQRSFIQSNRDAVQRYIDSIVMAIAALRKDKAGGMAVYKKELKVNDEKVLGATYDYALSVFPDLPYAKADQLADSVRVLGAKSAKVKAFDLSKMLDESFVKSAGDRGLNKP